MSGSHSHSHSHGAHGHSHSAAHARDGERRLLLSFVVTLAFVGAELYAASYSRSLALFSDAGHNLADALALVFSWYASWISRKPADARRTFGYHRWSILAALVNAVSLVLMAIFIFWEAIVRLRAPEPPMPIVMIVVAGVAVFLNGGISVWLHGHAKHDLNYRSAYLHMLGDALSALGVVIAGLVIHYTGYASADAIVSLVIGALILFSSWSTLVESINVLLENAPRGLDMPALEKAISSVEGVLGIHDLHVWNLSSGIVACSCHILVSEQSVREGQQVLARVVDQLRDQFSIVHTTVQVEVEGCDPNDMYCALGRTSHSNDSSH